MAIRGRRPSSHPATATPPVELVLPWNLALFVALYGCGALVCRELARRHGLGVVALGVLAFVVPRRPARTRPPAGSRTPPGAGLIAFGCTAAHFTATYSVGPAGLPWPLGVLVAVLPVAIGVLLLRPADPVRVVSGVLAFFAVLCAAVGLGGQYDTSLLGVLGLAGLVWWRRRAGRTDPMTPTDPRPETV